MLQFNPAKALLSTANFSLANFASMGRRLKSKYVPRRALMYVPGCDERKIKKAASIDADLIVLDCEDGVAMNQKEAARESIHEMLNNQSWPSYKPEWAVRLNSVSSGLCELDMKAVLNAANKPPCILLPKVENVFEIKWFLDRVKRSARSDVTMNLIIYSETPNSLMRLPEIVQYAIKTQKFSPLKLVALVFGSDDYVASIGATRTNSCMEVLYARQRLVMVAKAFGLQAIDMVHIDINDLEGLKRSSEEGASWGFSGRQVIHPSQVPIVQSAFSPSQSKVEWASKLIEAFRAHQEIGKGAFVFQDQMIDMPTLKQAENVISLAASENK